MLVSRRHFASLASLGLAGFPFRLRAARPRPKLIVLLIAEQFRADYLDIFSNFLVPGGFRRLMEDGAYFPGCQMAASTFTSGGLATLSTGAYPWLALGNKKGGPPLRTLAFDPARPEDFLALYRASPFCQAVQMALAREMIIQEKLGRGQGADLLAVSLGSTALLGYEVGGDSPLMREMVLHLDRQVEALLSLLDKSLGARNYALVFTSAHGAPCDPDGHAAALAVSGETVAGAINQALSAHYDTGHRKNVYVERYLYPFLYARQDLLRKSFIDPREARVVAGQAALTIPGVAGYYTADGDSSHSGDWLRRFRNSFHAVRSGDVMLAYAPQHVEYYGDGRGISYGSLYNYDSLGPLILYGAAFETQLFETPVESVDLAPTLPRVAGIGWPSSSNGRV